MPCPECPETPDTGCLHPITTECVTYDGNDIDCADISSGQSLNQVIEQLANNDCQLEEDIEDINQTIVDIQTDITELSGNINDLQDQINNLPEFTCEDLSGCSLDDLSDVDVSPASGDNLVFNGEKWVNYTPEEIVPYQFTCEELSGCTLDELSGVVIIDPLSGDVIINNGSVFRNYPLSTLISVDASNGLTELSGNVKLGGTLIENTTIDGNINLYDLIINNAKSFSVTSGVSPGTAGPAKAFFSFDETPNYNSPNGYTSENHIFKHYLNGYNLINGKGITSHNIISEFNIGASTILQNGCTFAATFNFSKINATAPNVNFTKNQAEPGAGTTLRLLTNNLIGVQLDSGSTDITKFVTINKFANQAIITNYESSLQSNKYDQFFQVYIGNAKGESGQSSSLKMPDTYGIWQEGADDKNFFRGDIMNTPLVGVGNRAVYSTANGTLTNSSSDGSLKTNVEELNYGLDTILSLKPISYNWINEEKLGNQREIGFIAQEVLEYIPEVIGKNNNDTLSVDYPKIVAVLVNAVKELTQKVNQLENAIK